MAHEHSPPLRALHVDRAQRPITIDETNRQPELPQDTLAALLGISQALSKHRDREGLFGAIAEEMEGLLPAERLIVLVPDSQGAAVSVYAVHGVVKLFEGERIPEESVAAWVVQYRQPMVVSSPEQVRESFPTTYQRLVEEGMQSLVVLPLLVQDRCLGALGFMARATGAFESCPQRLLDEIANSVAIALDSCLAFEQLDRLDQERKALLKVNAAVGRHLERDELFGAMAVCLRDLVPTERFGIELPIEGDRLQGHLLTPRSAHAEPTHPTVLPAAGTACDWVLRHRQWVVTSSRDELRERFPITFRVMSEGGMESLCAMPLVSGERCPGVLFFMAARKGAYEGLRRDFLEQVAGAVAVALDDCLAHEEVRQLRDRLAAENVYLQEEILQDHNFREIVGGSQQLRQVLSLVETVAPTSSTVLILGETGTGKELIARAIHDRSPRRERPLVKVNCSAIPAGLVESELFGHVKGAFTGAMTARSGRFELADGGTIFLDEIGELAPETQVKLLRVLQEREFEPVGSNQTRRVDVRVIAATNRDLQQAVAQGRFRSDLFFRVNVLPIRVPALRERREDIPLLVHFFVERFAREMTKHIDGVSQRAMEQLMAYDWPGNVRELQNIIERSMVLTSGPMLELGPDFVVAAPSDQRSAPQSPAAIAPDPKTSELRSLDEVGKQHILSILERCSWVIEGPNGAARLLGLQPSTLRSRLKKLGLQAPSSSTR
ncbi:MAG: sigma 54-interacting transcriptional regulator [Deltaproteobacteria bacterium]|nr:sigma 54-interacting transcriptional regulator [Deltaproteobacteria bacterium]MBI3388157.1 sigma 54-interacting transcriptional regulator [Deltaproteobacteria bacterium]